MLNVPLTVRLTTASGDKHVTRRLRDLSFRSVIPGGYASAALSFDQPLATTDPAVGLYGKVYIYDGRSGATVWEGRQEDPGRGATANGQVWTLQAFGPSVHAQDRRITVCYVQSNVENWLPSNLGIQTASVAATDDTTPSIRVALNNGTVVGVNASALAQNRLLNDCGQKLARFKAAWKAGVTDAGYSVLLRTRPGVAGTITTVGTALMNTAGGTLTAVITTDIPAGDDVALFQLTHTAAAGTVVDDTHWISAQIVLQGTRYTAAGVEQTAGATYSSDTVLSSDVVKDLLGRVLTSYDGALATVATTSYGIDRLVYPDPTSPEQILTDLMALEPACYWAAWESTVNGKARFEWSAWPTSVRYETAITGDFDSPGSAGDLFNAVLVRYRDANGVTRSVRRTLAQADLDAAGLTREDVLDLGDNVGSPVNAAQAGDKYLGDHNSPPNAGTLAINTPIVDITGAKVVQPWEIVPGTLIRVRGVLPRVDALNASARDAVTVFRIMSTEYQASTNTMTVELDSYSRSLANQVVAAHTRIDQLRRR